MQNMQAGMKMIYQTGINSTSKAKPRMREKVMKGLTLETFSSPTKQNT